MSNLLDGNAFAVYHNHNNIGQFWTIKTLLPLAEVMAQQEGYINKKSDMNKRLTLNTHSITPTTFLLAAHFICMHILGLSSVWGGIIVGVEYLVGYFNFMVFVMRPYRQ